MAEIGIRRGLAQDFGFNQGVADLARQNDQMRQAKMYAENQAKMLAEDFDYNNAMNAWDNEQVKGFAKAKINELGAFIRDNPDYKYNVQKRIVYNNLKKELKDNRFLNEGMQVDSNIKNMMAWKSDPKNAPLVDTPEFKQQLANYENYLKTGSIDGNTTNRKLFTFTPPEEHMDTTPDLMKYANAANYDEEKTVYLSGSTGAKKRWISDARKGQVAAAALGDAKLGRELRWEYNKYLSEQGEGAQPMTLEQYAVTKLNPYFKQQEYDKFSVPVRTPSSDGDGSKKGNFDLFTDLIKLTSTRPGTPVAANAKGTKEVFTGGNEQFNLSGTGFMKSNGEIIPFNNVTIPTSLLDVSGSRAVYDPNRKATFLTAKVTLPLDQAKNILVNNDPINDPWSNWLLPKGMESMGAKEGFEGITPFQDADGNWMVTMDVTKPVESNNKQVNAAYDHAAGQEMSGYSGQDVNRYKVSPDGTQYVDTFDGAIYDVKTNQRVQ